MEPVLLARCSSESQNASDKTMFLCGMSEQHWYSNYLNMPNLKQLHKKFQSLSTKLILSFKNQLGWCVSGVGLYGK